MLTAAPPRPIFKSNSALSSRTPYDGQDNPRDLPIADHLFMGIVCVDISAETSTPKSLTDETGATGQCWLGFLAYLDLLHFEERPLTIVLECVQKLDHNRSVQGRIEKGTLLAIEALKEVIQVSSDVGGSKFLFRDFMDQTLTGSFDMA